MTTTEKLLALAEQWEQKAAALRLAAAELNGHATSKKQAAGINGTLQAAIELRASQRGTPGPKRGSKRVTRYAKVKAGRTARDRKWYKVAQILHAAGKPVKIADLAAAARAEGIDSLTGIQSTIKRGWISMRGDRYVCKTLPPDPETVATD